MKKIIAVVDHLNLSFFESREKPSIKALMSVFRDGPTTDEEQLSYDWITNYEQVQKFFEIMEDYIRESKDIIDAKIEEISPGQSKGAA